MRNQDFYQLVNPLLLLLEQKYKGYIQLAQRSGQYKALNALEVYEGQLVDWNPLTEEFTFDYNEKKSDSMGLNLLFSPIDCFFESI
jgi:hypothetical protein